MSHFGEFEQVKKIIVMWLTLDKSRIKPITNLPLEKLDA